jgi:hypothetical protein
MRRSVDIKQHDSWTKITINRSVSVGVYDDMITWCREQNSDSFFYANQSKPVIDPSTFEIKFLRHEFWFERPEMANWFNLRWSHS